MKQLWLERIKQTRDDFQLCNPAPNPAQTSAEDLMDIACFPWKFENAILGSRLDDLNPRLTSFVGAEGLEALELIPGGRWLVGLAPSYEEPDDPDSGDTLEVLVWDVDLPTGLQTSTPITRLTLPTLPARAISHIIGLQIAGSQVLVFAYSLVEGEDSK